MPDSRLLQALRRIDSALGRIEAAADRPPAVAAAASPALEECERLREAHDLLRRRVIGAIGQLDDLIAAGDRG